MPKQSPKGGKYVLTGVSFRQKNKSGGWTKFEQGDEVTLTDEEAARLCSGKISSFKLASEVDDEEDDDSPRPSQPSSSSSTVSSK